VTQTRNVGIVLFDDVELLDYCGPCEVFAVAARDADPPPLAIFTAASRPGPVTPRSGPTVNPHYVFEQCPRCDLLVVPGGWGTRREMHNPVLIDWIRQRAGEAELVLSVCTGSLLLAKAGLLDGLEATTHHRALDLLRQTAPRTTVREGCRFVDNGKIVTSAGIAAGIDAALHVVARLLGLDHAENTARYMEYPWPSNN
jgi:transcriptional regulator GlxA family with amidase domain